MKVSGRRAYIAAALAFVVGLASVMAAPEPTLVVLASLVPIMIAAATISTVYLARVFQLQPIPRSRFFGMLIESFLALVGLGVWVGYLTVARLSERADFGWILPAPPPAISSPISALLVVIVFGAPVRFALEVYRIRRTGHDGQRLDRQGDEPGTGGGADA